MYMLIPPTTVDLNGITDVDEVEVAPAGLVELFGPPNSGEQHKITGEYVFKNEQGGVFVLHDWKATSLFWGDGQAFTPTAFWELTEPHEMMISSLDLDPTHFIKWLGTLIEVKTYDD